MPSFSQRTFPAWRRLRLSAESAHNSIPHPWYIRLKRNRLSLRKILPLIYDPLPIVCLHSLDYSLGLDRIENGIFATMGHLSVSHLLRSFVECPEFSSQDRLGAC